jgi:ABC-type phosphate transport system ATPase subunit
MAFPTAVNSQITDAITQSSVKVLGDAPSVALANLYQAVSHALATAAQNATNTQQQNNILAEAVTAKCAQILIDGQ